MLSSVINIRTLLRAKVFLLAVMVHNRLSTAIEAQSEKDVLVNEMLRACLHAPHLHPQYRLVRSFTSEIRICAKAFPVPASLGDAAHVHHGPEGDVDAFAFVL